VSSIKGYNSEKYCQEVLISLVDEIEMARVNNKNGALLSLDIRKAFDTISHQYIKGLINFSISGTILLDGSI
jgi:hypothetical protein